MASLPSSPLQIAELGSLELIARRLVEGMMTGRHRSPYRGSSVEFVEHRDYTPGDEIRHIDWRAWGRTGRYYIREFEDETNLRAHLLVDASGSMIYAGNSISKFDYARMIAASMACLLLRQRDSVGLTTFDTEIRKQLRPSSRQMALQDIAQILETTSPGKDTSLADVIRTVLPTITRRSLLILISDCLDEIPQLETALQQCRHARHEVIVFRIAAPEETEFPFRSPTQFRSLEVNGQHLLVDPARLRQEYLRQYQEFTRQLDRICGNLGIDYISLLTTDAPQDRLGNWLDGRMRHQ